MSIEKKAIVTENAPKAIGPYSAGICAGDFIFTAGQLPVNPATGEMPATIEEQTRQSLNNVKAILEEAGSCMDKVVKTTVFLQDLADFGAMNGVYAEFFTGACPARSAFQVVALPKGAKVEIEAVAIK